MKTKNYDYFKIMNETEAKNHDSSCYHSFSNIEYPVYNITICICFSLMNSSNKQQLREI